MYDYLQGQVASRSATRVVLDVHGVGYELCVPVGARVPAQGEVRLWTHLVVREDAWQLYGFDDPGSRELFRALLTVSGVGPKIAISVLSGLSRADLLDALASQDAARLTAVRGVGRRTAEQILLDLRDKVAALAAASDGSAPKPLAPTRARAIEDAAAALIGLGYSEKDARKQIERAAREVDPSNLELLVRTALQG